VPHFEAFVENSNLVTLSNLKRASTGAFVNSAVVTVEDVLDKKGQRVDLQDTSVDYPLSMPHVTGSNGTYTVDLPPSLAIVAGNRYKVVVKALFAGLTLKTQINFVAEVRDAG